MFTSCNKRLHFIPHLSTQVNLYHCHFGSHYFYLSNTANTLTCYSLLFPSSFALTIALVKTDLEKGIGKLESIWLPESLSTKQIRLLSSLIESQSIGFEVGKIFQGIKVVVE